MRSPLFFSYIIFTIFTLSYLPACDESDANGSSSETSTTVLDLDGDSTPDGSGLDTDNDGILDGIDFDGDDSADLGLLDTDSDGIVDAVDLDSDNEPDLFLQVVAENSFIMYESADFTGESIVLLDIDNDGNVDGLDFDGDGNADWSVGDYNANDSENEAPVAGGDVTVSNIHDTGFNLEWPAANDDSTAVNSLEYNVYISLTSLADSSEIESSGTEVSGWQTALTYAVGGLDNLTAYYVYILVRDEGAAKTSYPEAETTTTDVPESCEAKLATTPAAENGVYTIDPESDDNNVEVYCDMETDSGGWTLISVIEPTTSVIVADQYISDATTEASGKMPLAGKTLSTEILVKSGSYWIVYDSWAIDGGLEFFTLEKILADNGNCTAPHTCNDTTMDASLSIKTTGGFSYDANAPLHQWWRNGGWWVGADPFSGQIPVGTTGIVHISAYAGEQQFNERADKDATGVLLDSGTQTIWWR